MHARVSLAIRIAALSIGMVLSSALPARADVSLPSIIGNNMMLQQGQPVPIWGWAEPGEKVTVKIGEWQTQTVAGTNGEWKVQVPKHDPGGPVAITIAGKNSITLTNVLFGEVWICSGQSNMGWGVGGSASLNDMAKMNYPMIRQYCMHIHPTNVPQRNCIGSWRIATSNNVHEFCAVGFWFAEKVHQETKMPMGLLHAAYGSSSAETWTPRQALRDDPDFAPMFERAKLADMPALEAKYAVAMTNWEAQAQDAKKQNKPEPSKPQEPKDIHAYIMRHAPGNVFDGMIMPLVPFGIRGALWYQGEHNAPRAQQYRKVLPILIRCWRAVWGQGDFPFFIVQLPNTYHTPTEPRDSEWAEMRETQAAVASSVSNCYMAVTIDTGDGTIHPVNKWDVGKRLALIALDKVYGRKTECYGPSFDSMTVKNGNVVVRFKNTDGGLMVGKDGTAKTITGFAVAGEDRKFAWADAWIQKETVVLSNATLRMPVAVRYAWGDNPACNLYNKAGLPAAPFRTDKWPGIATNL